MDRPPPVQDRKEYRRKGWSRRRRRTNQDATRNERSKYRYDIYRCLNWDIRRQSLRTARPNRHGVNDAVRFGRRSDFFLADALTEIEGVAHHRSVPRRVKRFPASPVRSRFPGRGGRRSPNIRPRYSRGLPKIDVFRPAPGQGAWHAGHHPHRPQVDILLHRPPDGDQQLPQRDMIGHAGKPTAPKKMASNSRNCARPSSGMKRPVLWKRSQPQSNSVN